MIKFDIDTENLARLELMSFNESKQLKIFSSKKTELAQVDLFCPPPLLPIFDEANESSAEEENLLPT